MLDAAPQRERQQFLRQGPGKQLGSAQQPLLEDCNPAELADASALLVEIVRLRIELRQALGEVESSRARLLQAGYDERRRLRHELPLAQRRWVFDRDQHQ